MQCESDDRLLTEIDPAAGRDAPGGEHDLWLSMKSAHNRYKDASASLDALTAMSPAGVDSAERNLQIEAAAAEQRTSFEDYIEARLQLSEFMLSRLSPQPEEAEEPQAPDPRPGGGSRGGLLVSRIAVLAVVAAFLFPTAFGLGFLAHERRRTRDLEAARDEANQELKQMRTQIEGLAGRMEALKAATRSVSAAVAGIRASRVRAVKVPARAPAPSGGRVARNHQELVQLEKRGERTYREFTLTPSKQSERIGPVGLTVLKVDPQRKSFELFIAVDNLAPNRKRVNLYESVWIDLKGRPRAVELVVNRIDRDRVQGYVSEPKYPHMTWLRASP